MNRRHLLAVLVPCAILWWQPAQAFERGHTLSASAPPRLSSGLTLHQQYAITNQDMLRDNAAQQALMAANAASNAAASRERGAATAADTAVREIALRAATQQVRRASLAAAQHPAISTAPRRRPSMRPVEVRHERKTRRVVGTAK